MLVCFDAQTNRVWLAAEVAAGIQARLVEVAPHFGKVSSVQKPLWLNGEYFKVRLWC